MRNILAMVLVLGLSVILGAATASADTVYTYQSAAYAGCSGVFASSGTTCLATYSPLAVTFDTSMSLSQLENLNGVNIAANVMSFTFADGTGLLIKDLAPTIEFTITTDGSGDILYWFVHAITGGPSATEPTHYEAYTYNISGSPGNNAVLSLTKTSSTFGEAFNDGTIFGGSSGPGTWSAPVTTTNVPEPSSLLLLGTGLLGLGPLLRRRIRSV